MFWNSESKKNSQAIESRSPLNNGFNQSDNKFKLQKKIEKADSAQFIFEHFGSVAIGLSKSIELLSENIFFDVPVLIAGKFNGTLHSTSDLIITETGSINGKISASNIYNFGSISGIASVKKMFCNLASSDFRGSLQAKNTKIEASSIFNATCLLGVRPSVEKLDFSDYFTEKREVKSSNVTQLSLAS